MTKEERREYMRAWRAKNKDRIKIRKSKGRGKSILHLLAILMQSLNGLQHTSKAKIGRRLKGIAQKTVCLLLSCITKRLIIRIVSTMLAMDRITKRLKKQEYTSQSEPTLKKRPERSLFLCKEDSMNCKHTALRCTNNRFFCLLCGVEVPAPTAEKPAEKPKSAPKRTRKSKAD